MRIRTIKPEFWSHPIMTRLDDTSRLLAIGLLNYADDEGYFYADPRLIRAALRPLDEDSTIVRRCIDDLVISGWVELSKKPHETHGVIGRVVNFGIHQRVDRPNKSTLRTYFDSTNARRTLDDQSTEERKGKEGKGKEVLGGSSPPKESEKTPSPAAKKVEPPEPVAAAEKKRNATFDAVVEACGFKPTEVTRTMGGEIGNAIQIIREVSTGLSDDELAAEIKRRGANYRQAWPGTTLTPSALAKHWATMGTAQPPRLLDTGHAIKQIAILKEVLARHPANPEFIGYDRTKVTPAQKQDFADRNEKLNQLMLQV